MRIAIRFEGDPSEVMTFAEFAELNPREAETVARLEPDEGIRFGGGAAPVVDVLVLA